MNNILLFEAFLKRSEFDAGYKKKGAISGFSSKTGKDFPILCNQLVNIMCGVFDDAIVGYIAIKTGHIDIDDVISHFTGTFDRSKKEDLISFITDSSNSINMSKDSTAKELDKMRAFVIDGDWEDLEDRSRNKLGVSFTNTGDSYNKKYGMFLEFEPKSSKDDELVVLDRKTARDATANVYMKYKGETYTLYDGNDPLCMKPYDPTSFISFKNGDVSPKRTTYGTYGYRSNEPDYNPVAKESYKNILTAMLTKLLEVDIDELNNVCEMVNNKLKDKFDKTDRYNKRLSDFKGVVEGEYESNITMIEDIEDEMMDLYESDPDKFTKLSDDEYKELKKGMKAFSMKKYEEHIKSNKNKIKNDEDFVLFDFNNIYVEKVINDEFVSGEPDYGYGHSDTYKEDILIADVTNKKYYCVLDHIYYVSYAGRASNGD